MQKKVERNASTMNKTTYLIIAAVVIAVIIIVALMFSGQEGILPPGDNISVPTDGTETPPPELPAATGNIEDATAAILNDTSGAEVPTEETDETLTSEDTQAISDFGQSLDANQF